MLLLMLEDIFPSFLDSKEFKDYITFIEAKIVENERKKRRKEKGGRFFRVANFMAGTERKNTKKAETPTTTHTSPKLKRVKSKSVSTGHSPRTLDEKHGNSTCEYTLTL